MIRSLHWRLQAWNAVFLALLIAGYGGVLYAQTRRDQWQAIDGELEATARLLEGTLRGYPIHDGAEPPLPLPWSGRAPRRPPRDRPPWRPPPPPDEGGEAEPPLPPLKWTPTLEERLDHPYLVIWRSDGSVLASDLPEGAEFPPPPPLDTFEDAESYVRERDHARELVARGPQRTIILVGQSTERRERMLRQTALRAAGVGVGVWAMGLLGGVVLARYVLRPIGQMSQAAAHISAKNLNQRFDIGHTENELGQLAQVLNDVFSRLQSAFEQQIRFTADASHELRTPLAVVLSHAELALARDRTAAEYRDALETCQRAAQRMKALVESLLTLAQLDGGRATLRREPVDLATLAAECAAMMQPLAKSSGLSMDLAIEDASIIGDSERLAQVLLNLLSNAIGYNRPGGKVRLTVSTEKDQAVLRVFDTGIGIPTDEVDHVFERFFRVDKARSRARGGCGLGLAICHRIVEGHSGTITVRSQIGIGTKFTVRLPTKGVRDDDHEPEDA